MSETLNAPAGSSGAPANANSAALEASRVIAAGPTRLQTLTVTNTKGSAQFIQLHNTTTVPADTAVPVVPLTIAANATVVFSWGPYGRLFSTGLSVCNSSTSATKTIGSADCWFDAQHVPS